MTQIKVIKLIAKRKIEKNKKKFDKNQRVNEDRKFVENESKFVKNESNQGPKRKVESRKQPT